MLSLTQPIHCNNVGEMPEKAEEESNQARHPPSECDSNSNSGSLFSRHYPDEMSSSGSTENSPLVNEDRKEECLNADFHPLTKLQLRRRQLPAVLTKNPPKIIPQDVIDLATDEVNILFLLNPRMC